MKAIVLREFGPAENLVYEDVPDPEPGEGQVRIAVEVVGLHLIETAMREGLPIGPPLPTLPSVFGSEVAGVVDAIGSGVDEDWLGANVVTAAATSGGYAELAVADTGMVQRIPDGVDFPTAVAMIRTGTTTIGMLDLATLTTEDVVLVTGATGGIGGLIIQHSKNLGIRVIGAVGGPEKVAIVQKLGVDLAVDYSQTDWDARLREALGEEAITVVLDGIGGDIAAAAYGLLAGGGRFVSIGSASRQDFQPAADEKRGRVYINALMTMLANRESLPDNEQRALRAAQDGTFTATVQAFPLSQAAAAHLAMEQREVSGKVVLEP